MGVQGGGSARFCATERRREPTGDEHRLGEFTCQVEIRKCFAVGRPLIASLGLWPSASCCVRPRSAPPVGRLLVAQIAKSCARARPRPRTEKSRLAESVPPKGVKPWGLPAQQAVTGGKARQESQTSALLANLV